MTQNNNKLKLLKYVPYCPSFIKNIFHFYIIKQKPFWFGFTFWPMLPTWSPTFRCATYMILNVLPNCWHFLMVPNIPNLFSSISNWVKFFMTFFLVLLMHVNLLFWSLMLLTMSAPWPWCATWGFCQVKTHC
jgi:hypothetical protein